MGFKMWLENQQQWKSHIQNLRLKHQSHIVQDIAYGGFPYYDAENAIAHIHKSVDSIIKYWESLHEIGHLELNHKVPSNWDEEAGMEIEAWNYVKENSVVAIPETVISQWGNERIKGSWEQSEDTKGL